jgi:hypothetical protein
LAADLGKGGKKYALAFVIYRFAYNIPVYPVLSFQSFMLILL